MSGDGLYFYGIAEPGALPAADTLGPGLGGAAPDWVEAAGLAALVSPVTGAEVPASRRNMLAHTAVLERALAEASLLPLRFGTVAPDAAAVAACLARHAPQFRAGLREVAGRVELGVKVHWQPEIVFTQLLEQDAGLRRMRDRLRDRPAVETYAERIELGRRVEAALAARRAAEARRLLDTLAPLAERSTALPLAEDTMLLNHAFLVRRAREAEFDAVMAALAEAQGERLSFRYVGPVPPYNFVALQAALFGWEKA
ncbi:GvpL/GvpF family gas vesicle protein [Roseomonas sp. USHLN139]|uniref:GvpL/GvpF family gas vesicle protein n=1 Tax=Roseomonas sp. USHLN139 TaxID=3081298 RepID=UPI003B015640